MKKVLINAMTIKEGGGAVVFIKTLNEMIHQDQRTKYYVVLDETLHTQVNITENVTVLMFPWIKKSPFHLLWWNEFFLPRLIKKLKIDCFYSQINTLPLRKLECKTYLSVIHAGYFSEDFIRLNAKYNSSFRQKIAWLVRKNWVYYSIKNANWVTVPTKALSDAISDKLKISDNMISTILPGVGLAQGEAFPKSCHEKSTWRIGYITKYGVQKNFEVLFAAAAKLKAQQIDFKLILTLNENHPPFSYVNTLIQQYDIADKIENHGESSESVLRDLYLTLDIFVFPSLCESIGFTLLEAMYYGIPIIAAEIPSNCELLGPEGIYFKPYDSNFLCQKMLTLIKDADTYYQQSQYSLARSKNFSWEESAKTTLKTLGLLDA